MAWAPFAEGKNEIFSNPKLVKIAQKYEKTPAQVILVWLRQNNIVTIPKSIRKERLEENFMSSEVFLTKSDLNSIDIMDFGKNLILDIHNIDEVSRLHKIYFEQ